MHILSVLNSFLEDTGLIVAMAYLLARGRTLAALLQKPIALSEAGRLGVILGGIGLTEVIFPHDRYPYVMDTMIAALATLTGGPIAGLVCATTISVGAIGLLHWQESSTTSLAVFLTVFICTPMRRFDGVRYSPLAGLSAGIIAQTVVLGAGYLFAPITGRHPEFDRAAVSVFANGMGVGLITVVINDASIRLISERHRIDAERAKALATRAQLIALRARIHPHFLYNALTSIAGLCGISPAKAEEATIRLGEIMRRTLDASASITNPLGGEIENVRIYLDIEQNRLGRRLRVDWKVDSACDGVPVPSLSVQTLVENAVNHGIAPVIDGGTITVVVRRYPRHALVAVRDDGAGMADPSTCRRPLDGEAAAHGMQILSSQLVLLFGRSARLRVFSKADRGTTTVFVVPLRGAEQGRQFASIGAGGYWR